MRTAASSWNIPSNYGPHGELFFFLIKKEPTFYGKVVDFGRNASSDTEDGESFSGEDEEHNVENFMLCSCAPFACSPILQAFLCAEEMCKVALTSHCFVGRVVPLSGLGGRVPWDFLRATGWPGVHLMSFSEEFEGIMC